MNGRYVRSLWAVCVDVESDVFHFNHSPATLDRLPSVQNNFVYV